MDRKWPLVSILVLCYNNQHYIYENLKSIFEQTYPNLEVLIGDDASDNFDAEALIRWINKNRTPNIQHIVIYENEENLGTVANLERLQGKSKGEYLLQIAADDVLFDKNVIQSFYDAAVAMGDDGQYITAQTEMWDHELKNRLEDFLQDDWIEIIKNGSARDVFGESSWHSCLPACGFYRRDLIEKIGKLSDSYRLVEDWPWALRMTRMGIKPHYLEIRSSIKHRDGGISHGNTLHSQKLFLTYYHDCLMAYTKEIEPYEHLLTPEERMRAHQYFQDRVRAYYRIHLPKYLEQCKVSADGIKSQEQCNEKKKESMPVGKAKEREQFCEKRESAVRVNSELKRSAQKALLREELKKLVFVFSKERTIAFTFILGLLSIITMSQITLAGYGENFQRLFLGIAIILLGAVAVEVILNIWLRIRHLKQHFHQI